MYLDTIPAFLLTLCPDAGRPARRRMLVGQTCLFLGKASDPVKARSDH